MSDFEKGVQWGLAMHGHLDPSPSNNDQRKLHLLAEIVVLVDEHLDEPLGKQLRELIVHSWFREGVTE